MYRLDLWCTDDGLFVRDSAGGGWHAFTVDGGGELTFGPAATEPSDKAVRKRAHGYVIYGAFHLLTGYFVAVATDVRRAAEGPYGSTINQIRDMSWFPVQWSVTHHAAAGPHEDDKLYLRLLKDISETKSFYYGVGYDITNSLQRNDAATWRASGGGGGHKAAGDDGDVAVGAVVATTACHWSTSDDRFFWNREACKELITARADGFITPIMNGYVDHITRASLGAHGDVSMLLISRRACTRQGTRFNMRGADEDGNVANYVETEQLCRRLADGALFSYVQIRGSIPLMWEQPVSLKYTPKARLSADVAASHTACARHFGVQTSRYGHVTCINLIDKSKDQAVLGSAYEAAVAKLGDPRITYVWFDFHHECRNMKWHNLSKLVDMVSRSFDEYGMYGKSGSFEVLSLQKGVFRTNCMDNLDRTNVVQSLFARRAVLAAIPAAMKDPKASAASVLASPYLDMERQFNNLWANNADAVSVLYSGTGALKTDFTRTGRRTIMGAINDGINSVQRYVLNNLVDGRTQDAWDLFLGRFVPRAHHATGHPGVAATIAGSVPSKSHHAHHASTSSKHAVPLRKHMRQWTPTTFLIQSIIVFTGIASLTAAAASPWIQSWSSRLTLGVSIAAVAMSALAYLFVAKGTSWGATIVSKPTFIPANLRLRTSSHKGHSSDHGVAPVAPLEMTSGAGAGGGESGRAKLA